LLKSRPANSKDQSYITEVIKQSSPAITRAKQQRKMTTAALDLKDPTTIAVPI
jgi:hypothetical protein